MALQHRELMTQDCDLDVLVGVGPSRRRSSVRRTSKNVIERPIVTIVAGARPSCSEPQLWACTLHPAWLTTPRPPAITFALGQRRLRFTFKVNFPGRGF